MFTQMEMLDKDFGENEEPSVLSADPNERKLARRLRIQKRAEALQKLDANQCDDLLEESITEKQILTSAEILEKIISEGNEVITNVRVANDAREIERREEANAIRKHLIKQLEESAKECKQRYDTINERWSSLLESNDPLSINYEMEMQKKKCDQVLAIKDAAIEELKRQLQKADDKYFEDQKKQKDDIKLLIERIENQMSTMENVYSRELELIEKTLKKERDTLISSFQKKWDALYNEQEDENAAGDSKRNEILRDYEEEMEKVMTEHDEEYREHKIELEKECQALQQQVEKTKAMCILNAEKLTYNYTVLKSREEENSIVKSQQKRKINKLQGIIKNFKKNYSDLEENTKLEIEKLSGQIFKAHKSIMELEEKSAHFTRINEKQYLDIWNMNTENANRLIKKILTADKIICEQTLGIIWDPPVKSLPKKEDLPSYCTAINVIQKQKQEEIERLKMYDNKKTEKTSSELKLKRQVLNNILKQISNHSEYLVEDKLQELIADRNEEEKTIIKLDSVFQALSISTPEEVNMLLNFFLPYSYCPICSTNEDIISSKSSLEQSLISSKSSICTDICDGCNDENVRKLIDNVKEEIGMVSQRSEENENSYLSSDDFNSEFSSCYESEKKEIGDKKSKVLSRKYMCTKGHLLEIQAAQVTKIMKDIVRKYCASEEKEMLSFVDRLKEKKYTISRNLTVEDVTSYWSKYREVFGVQQEKLWDAVLMGLNKYYEVLKERHKLFIETESLRKQNEELQHLLQSHTTKSEDGLSILQGKSAKYTLYKSTIESKFKFHKNE